MSWWEQYPLAEESGDGPGALGFLNRGIASGLGGAVDAVNWAISPITKPLGIHTDQPLGGSASLRSGMGAIGADVASPEDLADSYPERIAEGTGLAASMLLPGGAAVGAATRAAAPVARGTAQTVARPFISQPVRATGLETAAGAGAGAGGLYGERKAPEVGVDPAMGRMAGELIGGFGAAAGPGMAVKSAGYTPLGFLGRKGVQAARASFAPFTRAGAYEQARRKMRDLSGAPAEDAANITGDTTGNLTPAQETGNLRLMALERAILDQDAALDRKFAERSQQGTQALRDAIREPAGDARPRDATDYLEQQQTYLRGLLEQRITQAEEAAQQRLARLSPQMRETEASTVVRRELDNALRDARAQERQLWGAVPEHVTVPTASAKEAFAKFRGQLGRAQMDDLPPEAARFLDSDQSNTVFGERETVREMHALYSKLRETARKARSAGDANTARIADGIADGVLRDLEADSGMGSFADAEDAFRSQQDVDRFFAEHDRLSREVAGFGKRPLTQEIIRRGGVDPSSPAAQDLRAAGVNVPGLYRRGGLRDLDNITLDADRGVGTEGLYSSRQGLIDGLVAETRGARYTPEQQETVDALARMEEAAPEYQQRRAEIEQAGRVEAPFPGDFPEDVAGPLQSARAFSRELNRTFRQGRVGDILGREREGGFSTPAETTLGQTIGTGGAKAAVAADELRAATRGSVDAEAAMRDYMRRRFTDFAAPRGEFRPERAQDFLRQNAELLDRFPDLKREIEGAAETGRFAQDARRVAGKGLKEADRTATAAFINAPFEKEFQSVLRAQNPRAAAQELARRVAQDETGKAARGLKAAALEHLTRDFDPKKMRGMLADARTRAAISEVLGPEEMRRATKVITELEKAQRAQGRLPSVDTSTGMISSAIQYAANVMAARLGAQAGQGTSGASLLTANLATRRMRGLLEHISRDRAGELLRDAIQDPELFKSLLLDASKPQNAKRAERRLAEWLGAEAGQAVDALDGREEASRAASVDRPRVRGGDDRLSRRTGTPAPICAEAEGGLSTAWLCDAKTNSEHITIS